MPSKTAKHAAHRTSMKQDAEQKRAVRTQERVEEKQERQGPIRQARQIRNDAIKEQAKSARMKEIDRMADEDDNKKEAKPKLLDGKPGSGAGLKPGDWFAPKSNPGAAAQVPMQPLQPESLQSHGKGIIYDKDLDNPPFGDADPAEIDEAPYGSHPDKVDKKAEVKKADKMSARAKQKDPDNPSIGYKGKDATASPNPIGSTHASKTNVAGGSNSGSEV